MTDPDAALVREDEEQSESEYQSWKKLLELAELDDDGASLAAHLESLTDADKVHDFGRLTPEERGQVLSSLSAHDAADIVEQLPSAHAAEALEELAPGTAAELLEELASDDQADLLGQLYEESAEAILSEALPPTADSVRELLRYRPDTAGGRMISEFVMVPDSHTTGDVVAHLQANSEAYSDYVVQYVYVASRDGTLAGVLPLRQLLLAPAERPVRASMIPEPVTIQARAPLEDVFELFDHHHFLAVPVVDVEGKLVGTLLREDVDEARLDLADSQARKTRGIVGGEELRSLPLHIRSTRRLSWLSINIVLNVLAASVIAYYEETLQAVIALAVFLPIISDMSGCSGNQAVAVSLRELALGVTRPGELGRVLLKESSLGLINGIALGILLGTLAWLWKDSVALGVVVGVSLALNTLLAVCLGGGIPLLIRRLGFDPALASGPMLTTVTDLCGFFFVLSFATIALSRALL